MRTNAIVRGTLLVVTLLLFFPLSIGCGGGGDNTVVTGADQAAAIAEEEAFEEVPEGPPEGEGDAPIQSGSQEP